jgi:hypothetical protein
MRRRAEPLLRDASTMTRSQQLGLLILLAVFVVYVIIRTHW